MIGGAEEISDEDTARGGGGGVTRTIFRWRSYLPLIAVLGLAIGLWRGHALPTPEIRAWLVVGCVVGAAGLLLRFYAVGHAPPGTSGRHRRQYAAELNTFGIYSVLRHPLYAGNILVWAGASATSGWALGSASSVLVGVVMFVAIVRHEDAFLRERFGEAHREWAEVTPAFWPRPRLWRPTRRPFDWRRAVASEYSTLHSLGLLALIFAALRGAPTSTPPAPLWWTLLGVNSALYLTLRVWRRSLKRGD